MLERLLRTEHGGVPTVEIERLVWSAEWVKIYSESFVSTVPLNKSICACLFG